MKILALILLSPFVWWAVGVIGYAIIDENEGNRRTISAIIIGVIGLLAFWGIMIFNGL
jgi:uncharacterized membrane protein YuzA (DUF378 family)